MEVRVGAAATVMEETDFQVDHSERKSCSASPFWHVRSHSTPSPTRYTNNLLGSSSYGCAAAFPEGTIPHLVVLCLLAEGSVELKTFPDAHKFSPCFGLFEG